MATTLLPHPGFLLKVLDHIESRLPKLLESDDEWQTLDVNYEPPRVERLWMQYDADYRLYLHRIHPCEKALFHPHPWPSAIKIVSGVYEMAVGYGIGKKDPPEAARLRLTSGASYEMVDQNGWHYVRPIGGPSLSVMVTGNPFDLRHLGTPPVTKPLGPLNEKDRDDLFNEFRKIYWR
jgi:hypothetical protein